MKNLTRTHDNAFRIAFAAVAVCAALSGVARADTLANANPVANADEARQLKVSYADLNLNSQTGAAVLFQRIRRAADQVCEVPGTRDLTVLAQAKACKDHAIAAAVQAVKLPALTRLYDAKFGIAPNTIVAAR